MLIAVIRTSSLYQTNASEGAVLTESAFRAALEAIANEVQRPHVCTIHPRGGFCFECGIYWRRELDGSYHPVGADP